VPAVSECLVLSLKNLVQMVDNQALSKNLLKTSQAAFAFVGLIGILMRRVGLVEEREKGAESQNQGDLDEAYDALTGTLTLLANVTESDTDWRPELRGVCEWSSSARTRRPRLICVLQCLTPTARVRGLARVGVAVHRALRQSRRSFPYTRGVLLPRILPIQFVAFVRSAFLVHDTD
jgi:hypothetical protein